jgi:hypothetical protein
MIISVALVKKGILKSFDSGTYLASVQLIGSLGVWLDNVPTSRAIATAEMVTGRNVAVLFIDPSNFSDAVIIAVWT